MAIVMGRGRRHIGSRNVVATTNAVGVCGLCRRGSVAGLKRPTSSGCASGAHGCQGSLFRTTTLPVTTLSVPFDHRRVVRGPVVGGRGSREMKIAKG